jgi:hypothetical protein
MKNNKLYNTILFLVSINILGCYSYREVSREEYLAKDIRNKSKIILNNNDEIIIEENKNIKVLSDKENIIIIKDTTKTNIPFIDIYKIMEDKFDFQKTFFLTFWFSILGFVVIGLIIIISVGPITFS